MSFYSDPPQPMTAETVDEFEVWVFDASDLEISIIPVHATWNASTETYSLNNSSD
jgi:hypothetical protein